MIIKANELNDEISKIKKMSKQIYDNEKTNIVDDNKSPDKNILTGSITLNKTPEPPSFKSSPHFKIKSNEKFDNL